MGLAWNPIPPGSPVAEYDGLSPGTPSVALIGTRVFHSPTVVACAPGLGMMTPWATLKATLADPVTPYESLALTTDVTALAAVGLPEMSPVVLLIARPAGRPVAVQVSLAVWPGAESVAVACTLTGTPTQARAGAFALTTIVLGVTSQVNGFDVAVAPV